MLKHKYDREADALYITLRSNQYTCGKDLDEERRIDYDANNQEIGIELLSVSRGVNIQGLPFEESVLEILNIEDIRSYRFTPYTYPISTSGSINTTFDIQLIPEESEEQELIHGMSPEKIASDRERLHNVEILLQVVRIPDDTGEILFGYRQHDGRLICYDNPLPIAEFERMTEWALRNGETLLVRVERCLPEPSVKEVTTTVKLEADSKPSSED